MTVAWLWLYGPPGVGKSATGFELFEQLVERGERVAFVELDQIGMCMPAPTAARSAAKADNLLGMLDNFGEAGAHGVIVCGDIVETMRDLLTRAREEPVLCRLRADDDVTVERLTIRRSVHYAMSSSVYESYDVPAGDLDVTTYPLGVEEVASRQPQRMIYDRLLVANWDGQRLAFPVDEVYGIHRFEPQQLKQPPATVSKSRGTYARGILHWQQRAARWPPGALWPRVALSTALWCQQLPL